MASVAQVARNTVPLTLSILLGGVFLSSYVGAAETGFPCDNPRVPTAAEIAAGAPPNIKACPSDFQTLAPDGGEAKQYLRSIFRSSSSGCSAKTPEADKIEKLNPSFAICAAQFLKAVRAVDSSIYITSAYRTVEQQACMCGRGSTGCAAPGRSNHQRGTALDLHASNYAWLHAQIRKFSGLRHLTIANDPYHMEATQGGPCMTPGYQPPSFTADPRSPTTPLSGVTNQVRESISSLNQALGASSPPQEEYSSPQQYSPNQQQIDQAFTQSSAYIQDPGQPVLMPEQTFLQSTRTLSTFDRISAFATLPQSTQSSSTTTPFPFVLAVGERAVTITSNPPQEEDTTVVAPIGTPLQLTPPAQETFTSPDLNEDFTPSPLPQQSTYQAILAEMQSTLLNALAYLKPFGRPEGTYEYGLE